MAAKKRIVIEVEENFQRRLKVTAATQGISMKEYCQRAISKELERDLNLETMQPTNQKSTASA